MSTESILQRHDKSVKFKPMHQRERGLTENVVRNRKLPMMSRTQRDCREVRGLLAQPSRPHCIRVGGFDQVIPGLADRIDSIATSGQLGRNLRKVSPPHPLFQRARSPALVARVVSGWNGRI